ncbi:hypothetical protein Cni_G28124 [Canna indica]|uniref:Uncharacterized protein n=1 Tax=Canna indica TaxID=4628 RepID=A0AAQ3QNJ6_9LILI|nr:hypothetical protein Cni_G28124 [Canna indica]
MIYVKVTLLPLNAAGITSRSTVSGIAMEPKITNCATNFVNNLAGEENAKYATRDNTTAIAIVDPVVHQVTQLPLNVAGITSRSMASGIAMEPKITNCATNFVNNLAGEENAKYATGDATIVIAIVDDPVVHQVKYFKNHLQIRKCMG